MTPSPETAPATIATKPFALRAQAFATTVAACAPPGNQATSTPTTTDARWGHFKPSRRGQCKPSFSQSACSNRAHLIAANAMRSVETLRGRLPVPVHVSAPATNGLPRQTSRSVERNTKGS